MAQQQIIPLYTDKPGTHMTWLVDGSSQDDRAFDLPCHIQFVDGSHATVLDFSTYLFLDQDRANLGEERQRLLNDMEAFSTMLRTLVAAHEEYMEKAAAAVEWLHAQAKA